MDKPKYTIAVTGLNAIDSPGPGLAVIMSLKEAKSFDVRIVGLSYENLEPVIYMHDMVDITYSIPYPSSGVDVMMERFNYIITQEKIDFLYPNFDAELFNFIKLEQRFLKDLNIKMVIPTLDQFEARHKVNLYDYGKKYNLLVPISKMIFSTNEIAAIAEEIGYPMVVKGKFYDAKIAYNLDQAISHFHKISTQWGLPIIIQQFVHGTEVNVCGIGDGKGVLLGAVPMRKLYITDKGKAWAGVSIEDEKLMKATKDLVNATEWRGPFELEYIKTTDEKYYLLEINPRFPAWCYLPTGTGQNQVEKLINLAMNKKAEPFTEYAVGKMFIRYAKDMIVDMSEFEKISTVGEL